MTGQLDALVGADLSADPQLQLLVDAHAMRRYYERPEQPQQAPRTRARPGRAADARGPIVPTTTSTRRSGSFGSTPALLRAPRPGDRRRRSTASTRRRASRARRRDLGERDASTSPADDLEVLPPRRTAVVVDGAGVRRRLDRAWVGGALPLGDDEWVVLDLDPDASGLKLDQHPRNLARQYASEANGDPATSAPGTLRVDRLRASPGATGPTSCAAAAAGRPSSWPPTTARASCCSTTSCAASGSRSGTTSTKDWHSLHRRRVTVTGEGTRGRAGARRRSRTSGSSSCRRSTAHPATRRTATTCTRSSPAGTAGACPRRGPG